MSMPLAVFTRWDWGLLLAYFAVMVLIGWRVTRRRTDVEGYFLAGRAMPTWALALSLVATTLSVATFVGAPQETFKGDLTYLSLNLGGFIAVFIVAILFIPRLYAAGTVTIYGYIGQRFGPTAMIAMSAMFLLGRLLSSGARLFIAAIPVCLLVFGEAKPSAMHLIAAILLIGAIGTAYTVSGGIRAVVWTDTLQVILVMGAAILSIALLLERIPLSPGQIIAVLAEPGPDGHSKLRLIDTTLDTTSAYTLWTALIGSTFLMVAAYGCDHDIAQRMMTARSPLRGSLSLLGAQVLSLIVVSLFLVLGLLLWVFYQRPDIMGAGAPADAVGASHHIYPQFLLNHIPAGLAGLAMAGMFAAAQGSLDSAINAMASSAVADVYWPIRRRLGLPVNPTSTGAPRLVVMVIGAALVLFAIGAALAYDPGANTLIRFALGVMSFAYTGMLGVFLTALLTRRGSTASILAALATGLAVTTLLQDSILAWWWTICFGQPLRLSSFWWMPIGTTASFLVCILGRSGAGPAPALGR
jgi:solute:Na+ symporter, SSS family